MKLKMRNKSYTGASYLSVIASVGFFFILIKELLFGELTLSEIAVTPVVLGIILMVDLVVSYLILRQMINSNIFILVFQCLIIACCLYLIYYYSGVSVKVERVITP
ncbi:hypothetical protein FY557_18495 [Chryseobacterium sp. SN22]|uniref:hypothetical protein n=1 Tax=Chryseobacterium sp. SN22 TaxID=2606431 RepID=UPI00125AD5AA|nr:hypothetical protein [Chryseobacterium sp. SN22]KAA0126227.1 hypothetical protein FY557_18495 [Chryseobacterium sp. SN22]